VVPYSAVVSLRHWADLTDVDRVLQQCLEDLGGVERFVQPGQTVVIKPNLTANAPSASGGTTHVELVEAIVRMVQRRNPGRVIVAEGTATFGATLETAFPTGGWREMAARTGAELCNLDAGPHIEVRLEKPRYPGVIPFSRLVYGADVFITVPCLKTHLSADYTVALKNSYALTPQWKRSEIHSQYLLEQALTDLNRIRRADLTIVDGWEGAEGIAGGVAFERPAGARVMLAGADSVAVDAVAKEVMELAGSTRYLNWAAEDGVGVRDLAAIEVRGAPIEECRHPFLSPVGEICIDLPEVTICDQLACSGCRSVTLSILGRLRFQRLLAPLALVFGAEGDTPAVAGKVIVIGDCARRYQGLGAYVAGCPANAEAVYGAVDASGSVCHKCRDLAMRLLSEHAQDASFLSHLRVSASGSQVHSGDQVKRAEWHLELLVGDCMRRYAHIIAERAAQFGLDPERDVVWVQGCPADGEAVREGLQRLQAVQAGSGRVPVARWVPG
jgi:uncharacterized protein (DUF362 family)